MTHSEQTTQATTATAAEVPAGSRRFDSGVVIWCAVAGLLLAGSGFYRGAQASRFRDETGYQAESPFPLVEIPKVIDNWQVVEGSETKLDNQTTRITGSTDHVIRNYCDELTGVTLSVLILYGPAGPVTPHTPQVCYPASGFAPVGDVIDRTIRYGKDETADLRSSVFAKPVGRSVLFQTVYHTYELNGVWSPTIDNRKLPRRNPGVFKIQIQRVSREREARGENEPIESFVEKLLPVIEKLERDALAKSAPAGASRPA